MSERQKGLNDIAWEQLFKKYDILKHIERTGQFQISSKQIKEVREPRLMSKFDHTINLPQIFSDNKLSILPVEIMFLPILTHTIHLSQIIFL